MQKVQIANVDLDTHTEVCLHIIFFPDYCVVEPRLKIIICSILVDAVRGEVKRGPCGNYCRRTSTHYKTADCNGNVSHLNSAVKRLRMSCNCSEKLGMSFFLHQRI